ncbi:alpha/beta fold hydrolase [Paractinoplanes atraurantiacus]|uniref:Pimeloyl-ACP methyl ester carboxylesterase n=1 Tax=Paractinoplanes atraurantiacus TaxID=1036182 RepID=A0A285GLR8_9ACTN|nr:alpha/beta hydrolase [Actinoplanes atraurantiacus]SNY24395.1 Pimeloyl-ACP methyl ester carboxylesterase [Actinoplanes atraurantiacus]
MLSNQATRNVTELAEAVLSLRPLAGQLEPPVRAVTGTNGSPPRANLEQLQGLLDRVTARLAAPRLRLTAGGPADGGLFGHVVGRRLRLGELAGPLAEVTPDTYQAMDRAVDEAAAADFGAFCRRAVTWSPDGTPLNAYAAGDPAAPAVVIASACGMPARLAEPWIRRLAADHHVVTWESRGLFGDVDDFDGELEVDAQAGDLLAVMDHFGVAAAHVAGLCGGAVIALAAAARAPERVSSLSLWHGDFEVGRDDFKTDHQINLQALMAMATRGRVNASGIHAVVCQTMTGSVPEDLAHLVLYPYATPELLFRYCQLNGAIMGTDVRAELATVRQPTLVVTSEDDTTAHPEGSRFVAAALPAAELVVTPAGDHLSVFRGSTALLDMAAHFMRVRGRPGR